jgi:hypothetical protein
MRANMTRFALREQLWHAWCDLIRVPAAAVIGGPMTGHLAGGGGSWNGRSPRQTPNHSGSAGLDGVSLGADAVMPIAGSGSRCDRRLSCGGTERTCKSGDLTLATRAPRSHVRALLEMHEVKTTFGLRLDNSTACGTRANGPGKFGPFGP